MVYDLAGQQLMQQLNPYSAYAKANQQANLANELAVLEAQQRAQQLQQQMQGSDPSAVREYQYYSQLTPEQQQEYLRVKRAQQTLDLGGYYANVDPTTGEAMPVAGGVKTLAPENLPQTKYEQSRMAAAGTELGKKIGEQQKAAVGARDLNNLVVQAKQLLPQSTSGMLQQFGTAAARTAGVSTEASKADAKLKVLSAKLTASVPRFEGPQGVLDVELYKEAAGNLANSSLPYEDRIAAAEIMEQLNAKYMQNDYGDGFGEIVLTPDPQFEATPTLAEQSKANFKGKSKKLVYNPATGEFQ